MNVNGEGHMQNYDYSRLLTGGIKWPCDLSLSLALFFFTFYLLFFAFSASPVRQTNAKWPCDSYATWLK